MPQGVRYGVSVVRSDGTIQIPGGLVARIGSGAAGTVVPYPLVGYFDDGRQSPVVFFDNGPTPLIDEKIDGPGHGFPVLVLTGLTPGLSIAWVVAITAEAALRMGSGGNVATDTVGRLITLAYPGGVLLASSTTPLSPGGVFSSGNIDATPYARFGAIVTSAGALQLFIDQGGLLGGGAQEYSDQANSAAANNPVGGLGQGAKLAVQRVGGVVKVRLFDTSGLSNAVRVYLFGFST